MGERKNERMRMDTENLDVSRSVSQRKKLCMSERTQAKAKERSIRSHMINNSYNSHKSKNTWDFPQ